MAPNDEAPVAPPPGQGQRPGPGPQERPGPPQGRRSGRRLLLAAAAGLALLLAGLIGAGTWVWRSESALTRLVPWVPGLSVSGQQGRPTGGPFSVQRLQWQGGTPRIVVEGLAWDDAQWTWRPRAAWRPSAAR